MLYLTNIATMVAGVKLVITSRIREPQSMKCVRLIVSALIFVFEGFPVTSNLIPGEWRSDSVLYQPVSDVALKLYPVLDDQTWIDDIKSQIDLIKEEVGVD